jgi:catechol 2,3-dioxygenase-like lactoylglutathione lyase family enzyme
MNENQERQMKNTTEVQADTTTASSAEWPEPQDDIRVTNLLIVRDIARSRHFYADILGAQVLRDGVDGPPAILRFHNTWLVLSTEGGPTDDKPDVIAVAPRDSKTLSSALNLRVTNICELYERWRALGAEFLTPPKEHEAEIRCYMCDPDGHLIEVGQAKPGAIESLRGE